VTGGELVVVEWFGAVVGDSVVGVEVGGVVTGVVVGGGAVVVVVVGAEVVVVAGGAVVVVELTTFLTKEVVWIADSSIVAVPRPTRAKEKVPLKS
jgi:hypothetical protein